ncbi:MAG: hypothetical protein Q4B87_02120 [Candidatus Saccharibacteria bacterium]|nr:hypothetical protein [Candidatus Saccharibacteria bacterium]
MDGQDYLNQITESSKPKKVKESKGFSSILSSKYFKWGAIFVVVLLVIMIFGSILSSKPSLESKFTALKLQLDRTVSTIDTYQPMVKSSDLRSLSASLKSVLSSTSTQLGAHLAANYAFDEKNISENLILEADTNAEALNNDLFEAKINGRLDRTYAHKMATEIYTIMSKEAGIINSSSDDTLKSILKTSYDSLNNLYPSFNDYSETK